MGPWQYWVKQREFGFFVAGLLEDQAQPDAQLRAAVRTAAAVHVGEPLLHAAVRLQHAVRHLGPRCQRQAELLLQRRRRHRHRAAVTVKELQPGEAPFKYGLEQPRAERRLRVAHPGHSPASLLVEAPERRPGRPRGGYSKSYTREGLSDTSGIFCGQPWRFDHRASRNQSLGNLIPPGESWPLLYRDIEPAGRAGLPRRADLPAGADRSATRSTTFDPNTQTPWVHSFNVGFQRDDHRRSMAMEVRYVGHARARRLGGRRPEHQRAEPPRERLHRRVQARAGQLPDQRADLRLEHDGRQQLQVQRACRASPRCRSTRRSSAASRPARPATRRSTRRATTRTRRTSAI